MKYCSKCGKELVDEAIVCPNCGCAVTEGALVKEGEQETAGLKTAAKIFMILGCVGNALFAFLIPLIWCIPMTISYFRKVENHEKIGVGFKICSLLFVNMIAGILMLCDNKR